MRRWRFAAWFLIVVFAASGLACPSTTVTTDATADGSAEVAEDVEATAFDVDVGVLPDVLADGVDRADNTVDAEVDVRVDSGCAEDPPSGPPPGTNQSCGPGAAPSWHCQEAHFCGGTYRAGSTAAYVARTFSPAPGGGELMRTCDVHEGVVRTGYIDTYEVTVARFRAWIRAGRPHPQGRVDFFNGHDWSGNYDKPIPPFPNTLGEVAGTRPTREMCTYSDTPGVHDDLPMNCVPEVLAKAFCWWDGKHLPMEVAWEFVARNRGQTATPWGALPTTSETCARGDVGGYNGLCPQAALPRPVNAFPMGVTRDPPGVYGLYGGVSEWVIGNPSPYTRDFAACGLRREGVRVVDGELLEGYMIHGTAWFQGIDFHRMLLHSASRATAPGLDTTIEPEPRGTRSPAIGFRCTRWVPEPRAR